MSRMEPKAGEWLRQQIEELGALRTASVRDPQFKAWRQNTLTFIQRIWPGDQSRSERFRRIPFSPPSTRADARAIREQFERGCGEALECLNGLLAAVGEERVQPGIIRNVPRAESSATAAPPRLETDFPEVSLDESARRESEALEGVIGDGPMLDLPNPGARPAERSVGPSRLPGGSRPFQPEGLPEDFTGATPLDRPAQAASGKSAPPTGHESQAPPARGTPKPAPAPPSNSGNAAADPPGSRISVRGPGAERREPGANPLRDILDKHRKNVQDPTRSGRPMKGRKGGKRRLKDMLGLEKLDPRRAGPGSGMEGPARSVTPAEEKPAKPDAPTRPSPQPAPPAAEHATRPEASPRPPAPPAPARPEAAAPAKPVAPAGPPSGIADPDRWTHAPDAQDEEDLAPLTAEDIEAAEDENEPDSDSPAAPAGPEEDPFDPSREGRHHGEAARATADFMRNSPVLSSAPRPVKRRAPDGGGANAEPIPSRESAAGLILAIAVDVDSLGIPSAQRARARAGLMDLARHLDEPELSWDVLREGVEFVMEFPPLARRALPLLLPFLDVAA